MTKADIPFVWNSNAYYSEFTANILKDLVDIYLLDFRYFNNTCAKKLSMAPLYQETATRNMKIAFNDSEMIIRILVIPGHIECDAKPILKWIRDHLGENFSNRF